VKFSISQGKNTGMGMFKGKESSGGRSGAAREGSSLIAGCTLEGTFNFKGPTIIGAVVKGDITCDGVLIIEAGGRVEGQVNAVEIIVQGVLDGEIAAIRSIEVWPGAALSGDIYAPSISVAEGARVSASLLIALERPQAHINRARAANVTPISAARPPEPAALPAMPAEAVAVPTPAPRTMFAKAAG
jgi:cytoskeletal protein CcmA (bactofilin family)